MSGGELVVLIAPAGAGKSTWAKAHYRPTEIWCLDQLRGGVSDDECDQSATGDAVQVMNLILGKRLARGLRCVVDATNTEAEVRRQLLDLAGEHGATPRAVLFPVPLAECAARNAARQGPAPGRQWGRAVPEAALLAQDAAYRPLLDQPDLLLREGFATVTLAR